MASNYNTNITSNIIILIAFTLAYYQQSRESLTLIITRGYAGFLQGTRMICKRNFLQLKCKLSVRNEIVAATEIIGRVSARRRNLNNLHRVPECPHSARAAKPTHCPLVSE
jgi:hypothetical protein